MNKKSWIILAIVAVIAIVGIVGFVVELGKKNELTAKVATLEADLAKVKADLETAKADAAAAAEAQAKAEAEAAAAAAAAAAVKEGELTNFVDYKTTVNEMETFCIQYSQGAVDLDVLCNCIDGLLTNDNKGALLCAAAESYESPDSGKTWVFTLRDEMVWVDYEGNYKADVVGEDFAWGLEWVLNYAKNQSANTSMPTEMIAGAADYYNYTKELTQTEGEDAAKALGLDKFYEMVGMTVEDNVITYTLVDCLPYFPSVACYNCLSPISGELLEEIGVDGYFAVTYDTLWYNGPYTITKYEAGNEKVLTKNPEWYGTDKRFETVTVKMIDSVQVGFQLYETGDLDWIELAQSDIETIYNDPDNKWHDYLIEARPTKYSYEIHLVYNKNLADGETPDDNWNKAVANANFRKALCYGVDYTDYLARINAINPLSAANWCYTANAVAVTSDGRDYTDLVCERLGLDYNGDTYARYDAEKGAQYKAAAIEELTAAGVTFPVVIDYYISGSSQTAKDSADTLAQIFSDYLGDDFVKLNICTYVSSLANEVRTPKKASMYVNGWGADFADPINFLGQETYGDDNAYYSVSYSKINEATDPDLIATYQKFTDMVNTAKAITDDLDARYEAMADAEAYFIEEALCIPIYYNVAWQLTKVNNYSKIYSAYGNQAMRYVNWETNADGVSVADNEAYKAAYAE